MVKIDTDFKVGKPSASKWSGVLGYRPETDTLIEIFGEMFAVMSITTEIDFDLANIGGLLFDELQQSYFSEFKPAVELSDFESALHKVKSRIDAILEREETLSQTGIDLELAVTVIKNQVMYAGVVGESKIFIRREQNFAEIGSKLMDGEMNGFVRTGSMYVSAGDAVMLMTSELAGSLTADREKQAMDNFKLSDVPVIHGSALLIGYERPEPVPEPEHELLPLEDEFLEDEIDAGSAVPAAVEEVYPEVPQHAPHVEMKADPENNFVEPMGHVMPEDDDEEFLDDSEIIEPIRTRHTGNTAGAAAGGAVVASTGAAAMLARFNPQIAAAKMQMNSLLGKAKVAAGGLKDKAMKIKNEKMPSKGRQTDRDDEFMDEEPEVSQDFTRHVTPGIEQEDDYDMPDHSEDETMPTRQLSPLEERQARIAAASRTNHVEGFETAPRRQSRLANSSGSTFQALIAKAISWVKVNILGQTDRQQVYLRGQAPRNWKVLAAIGVIIALVLFLGIRKVVQDKDYQAQVLAAQTKVNDLSHRYDALDVQVTTLGIGTQDQTKKASVIGDLAKLVSDAQALEQDKIFVTETKLKTDIDGIISKAQTASDQASNIVAFTQPQVVSDIGVNFQNVDLSHMTYYDGKIYVADKGRGVVYRMGTALNSETTAFVSGLTSPTLLKATPDGELVVVDDNPDSCIATIDTTTGALKRQAGLSKAKIGTLNAIDIWTNGALYSVSQQKQALLKQENVAGNFQLPNDSNPWRNDSDFASGIDVAVDYWIYVLVRGKGLERYLGGEPDAFSFDGLTAADTSAMSQATAFDITATNLYIADPLNKRIMVFAKDTNDNKIFHFKQQYVYRGTGATFTKIKDLAANEETKKLYVLDGSQVIRLDL